MNKDLIEKDEGVKLLKEDLVHGMLVGGAIIDLDRNCIPKDYDVTGQLYKVNDLINKGWKFICETKTAITLFKNGFTLQLLKTISDNFEFKISQSSYNLKTGKLEYDKISYDNKTLIPTKFDDPKIATECLLRIPHYKIKGYTIHDMTYLSLLNTILKNKKTGS